MAKLLEGQVKALADKWGRKFGVSPRVLVAIAWIESRYNPKAIGDGGESYGLMQLHGRGARAAWKQAGNPEVEWFNPDSNMHVAAWFVGQLLADLRRQGRDTTVRNVVVAYNAGMSRVKRADADLPEVTKHYLRAMTNRGVGLSSSASSSGWSVTLPRPKAPEVVEVDKGPPVPGVPKLGKWAVPLAASAALLSLWRTFKAVP
jgi:hypothetical protein